VLGDRQPTGRAGEDDCEAMRCPRLRYVEAFDELVKAGVDLVSIELAKLANVKTVVDPAAHRETISLRFADGIIGYYGNADLLARVEQRVTIFNFF
jgi:hypothetical protein